MAAKFSRELDKVLQNIADPNTDPTKARKLTVELKFVPNENRDIASVEIIAKSSVQSDTSSSTAMLIDRDREGNVVGAELKSHSRGQMMVSADGEILDDKGSPAISN